MKTLEFQNAEFFYDRPNVTVRLGDKWAKAGLEPGNVVELTEHPTGNSYGVATWCGCMVISLGQLCELPTAFLLQLEHDESCVTPDGIIEELIKVYGRETVSLDEVVTIVFFIPHGSPGEAA